MKYSIISTCAHCGHRVLVRMSGTTPEPGSECARCKQPLSFSQDGVVSVHIYSRCRNELERGDFTLAIILGAMAVEAELARVFLQWKRVGFWADRWPERVPQTLEERWVRQFREWGGIAQKLNNVSRALTGYGFDEFFVHDAEMFDIYKAKHPGLATGAPTQFFQEKLFWRRNHILHFGKINFGKEEAAECTDLAFTLFSAIGWMDTFRAIEWEKEYPAPPLASSA